MSIAHELSSEVAAAMLTGGEGQTPKDASERVEVVLEVHSTLRKLSAEYRRKTRAARRGAEEPPPSGGVSAGRR